MAHNFGVNECNRDISTAIGKELAVRRLGGIFTAILPQSAQAKLCRTILRRKACSNSLTLERDLPPAPCHSQIPRHISQERRLQHREEAEKFYRNLAAQGITVRVEMEASGHARWFERLLAELNFELWMGDAAEIRAKRVRKQKTDRQDAQLILS